VGETKFIPFLKSSIRYLFCYVLNNAIIESFHLVNFLGLLNEKFRKSI
jgi:hypothetical protein